MLIYRFLMVPIRCIVNHTLYTVNIYPYSNETGWVINWTFMCEIYRLDITAAVVISMKLYSSVWFTYSCLNLNLKMLIDFACTVSFAKLFQSRMTLAAKKSSNAPLWLPEYITSNCGSSVLGLKLKLLEQSFFCGHKGQCTSWSNWLKLCINLYPVNNLET